jgi:hypothetical protein
MSVIDVQMVKRFLCKHMRKIRKCRFLAGYLFRTFMHLEYKVDVYNYGPSGKNSYLKDKKSPNGLHVLHYNDDCIQSSTRVLQDVYPFGL